MSTVRSPSSRLLVLALVSASIGVGAGPAPRPEPERLHHRRAAPASGVELEADPFELEGILERGDDGALVLALPVRAETRARVARAQQVPLSRVPKTVRRLLHPAPGLAEAVIDLEMGKRIRALVARDRSGRTFLLDLYPPRRR